MKENKKRISVVVRKEKHKRWKKYAESTDQSVSELVRRSVNRSVEDEGLEPRLDRIESKLDILLRHLGADLREVNL